MGPLCPCQNSKKPMKKVPGASLDEEPQARRNVNVHVFRAEQRTSTDKVLVMEQGAD
ncbi:unnamed protein product [Staurois parvus]|uniref:Uncharacterized protein n=1 Tax=Staurois parvus TaxID=386267 RepID=A0ABN9EE00_9NEOB|nr:unnamed protein product [Staurois parvus]